MKCEFCPREATWRASLVLRAAPGQAPVLHEPRYVCDLHRTVIDRVPEVAVQKRIEADYRRAKLEVPAWTLSQLVLEPLRP